MSAAYVAQRYESAKRRWEIQKAGTKNWFDFFLTKPTNQKTASKRTSSQTHKEIICGIVQSVWTTYIYFYQKRKIRLKTNPLPRSPLLWGTKRPIWTVSLRLLFMHFYVTISVAVSSFQFCLYQAKTLNYEQINSIYTKDLALIIISYSDLANHW